MAAAIPDLLTKKPGFVHAWGNHIKEATFEPDGKTPSSARIYAGWLIAFVLFLQFMSTTVVLLKILWIRQEETNAPALVLAYTGLLRVLLLWGTLFDVATALSLYGINVWKYIASIANPLASASIGAATNALGGISTGLGFGGTPSFPGAGPSAVKPATSPIGGAAPQSTLHPSLEDGPDEDRT